MASIEIACIQDVELAHKGRHVGLGGLDHEMKMVAHQDIAMEPDLVGLHREPQAVDKRLAVLVIAQDSLARIPTTRHVVEGSRIGQA